MDREQMQRALADVWKRHLPEISERVSVLERACASIRSGDFGEEEREAAHAAAHKLAGVLGTFGQTRGSELARKVEQWLERRLNTDGHREEMVSAVSEIRTIVSRTHPGTG